MKKTLAVVCLLFLAVSVSAQMASMPKPEYYLIHEEVARPGMLAQYEATTREFLNMLTQQKADPKVMGMNLYTTTDMHYLYVVPIANFGGVDAINQVFATMGQAVGKERWADLNRRGNLAIHSYNEFVALRRPDLSYVPATPRLKPEERRFVHWQFYSIDAAHTDDAEQVAKDYVALFKSKNIGDGFSVYQVMSGNDLPLYVVASSGKSPADFYSNDERINAMAATEMRPLQARVLSYTRKYEVKDGTARPELSYPMPAATTMK